MKNSHLLLRDNFGGQANCKLKSKMDPVKYKMRHFTGQGKVNANSKAKAVTQSYTEDAQSTTEKSSSKGPGEI